MERLKKYMVLFLSCLSAIGMSQVTPKDELEYYNLSQQLVLELARKPEKMDSIMAEIDRLNALLLGKKKAVQNAANKIKGIKLAYFSAICQGYCTHTFVVTENFKEIIKTPGEVIPSPELTVKKDRVTITKANWEKITQSFTLDSIRALPSTVGCPGCDDAAIGTLNVYTTRDTLNIKFEGPNPPKAIQELTMVLTSDIFKE